ncbi:MAG: EscU/YscU/HrcU family type III secretion system export apparatus switch protein [Fimbriimonadaceae bacterium]|nr:EscU/YscU/HrcU family type III secretion system export apparatus switch protein [Fimbriimonadaceae bacterium]QYK57132.1 MAG: EscU/YscU/HrcU family type III secretion system export apparatus switch protein [Fimbriimonadaceae bacterium]
MSQKDANERTEEATPKRRREARERGQVAKSQELTNALGFLGFLVLTWQMFGAVGINSLLYFSQYLSYSGTEIIDTKNFAVSSLFALLASVVLVLLVTTVIGTVSNVGQTGLLANREAFKPKWDRINPASGFKRLFSKVAAFDSVKALLKLGLFLTLCLKSVESFQIKHQGSELSPTESLKQGGETLHGVLVQIGILWLIFAVFDYMFQKKEFEKSIRMTKAEVKREMREQEGSPEVKYAQHRRRSKLSKGSLESRLKKADVIVTNPTHFAVALHYDPLTMKAPMVLAKGQDVLAQRIRETAKTYKIPIVENRVIARAIFTRCEVGEFIPRELFSPVAEILAYVYGKIGGKRSE